MSSGKWPTWRLPQARRSWTRERGDASALHRLRELQGLTLQEVADLGPHGGPRPDVDIGLGSLPNGTQLAQAGRPRARADEDYTKFVRPEYELGCDVGERRSREFWQRRFGVTPD